MGTLTYSTEQILARITGYDGFGYPNVCSWADKFHHMTGTDVTTTYREEHEERRLRIAVNDRAVTLSQATSGYGMVVIRHENDGTEIERYYALEMALDHAAEVLDISPTSITVPPEAADMGL